MPYEIVLISILKARNIKYIICKFAAGNKVQFFNCNEIIHTQIEKSLDQHIEDFNLNKKQINKGLSKGFWSVFLFSEVHFSLSFYMLIRKTV